MTHLKHLLLLIFLCSLVFFTNCDQDKFDPIDPDTSSQIDNPNDGSSSNEGRANTAIYLAENGVTIKATENAIIGESYELRGISYLVVDSTMLIEKITNEEDITKIVTTHIKSLNNLFNSSPNWDLSWSYGNNFNQNISSWDVGNVTSMIDTFIDLPTFNQDISYWDVSSVTDMSGTFANCPSFNQGISDWNVGNVTKMGGMFAGATSFNQNLRSWSVHNVNDCNNFSNNTTAWTKPKPNFTNCSE